MMWDEKRSDGVPRRSPSTSGRVVYSSHMAELQESKYEESLNFIDWEMWNKRLKEASHYHHPSPPTPRITPTASTSVRDQTTDKLEDSPRSQELGTGHQESTGRQSHQDHESHEQYHHHVQGTHNHSSHVGEEYHHRRHSYHEQAHTTRHHANGNPRRAVSEVVSREHHAHRDPAPSSWWGEIDQFVVPKPTRSERQAPPEWASDAKKWSPKRLMCGLQDGVSTRRAYPQKQIPPKYEEPRRSNSFHSFSHHHQDEALSPYVKLDSRKHFLKERCAPPAHHKGSDGGSSVPHHGGFLNDSARRKHPRAESKKMFDEEYDTTRHTDRPNARLWVHSLRKIPSGIVGIMRGPRKDQIDRSVWFERSSSKKDLPVSDRPRPMEMVFFEAIEEEPQTEAAASAREL